ncbi:hypothetical protein A2164_03060 [Candidatus Curtissbacteria bacterium RBG_13_35_7]|uniref:AAA+ ATPase domain-containing protein n=1 Tax=Candidatus Curtissbacteria bacterium RBG_13_35_7 TaxID=1797705 RepID=A0A1F5G1J0_9BACT|nr:MAG: hypothetical protein A2164_03060 [Candidatus Curtissbacteria bacterium RBG_13_35_7]
MYDNQQIYKALSELEVIPQDKLKSAFDESNQSNTPFDEILVNKELISDENLGKIIASSLKVPFVSLAKVHITDDLLIIVPEILARNSHLIAFERTKDGVKLAMSNPNDKELINLISKKTGEKIIPHYATKRDITSSLKYYQKEMQNTFNDLLNAQVEKAKKSTEKEAPVSKIVDLLIEYAAENKASDIHIEPEENNILIRYRVDGILHDVLHLPRELHSQMVSRIKVMSRLRTDEHLSAQDGKMQAGAGNEKIDIRVSIVPIVDGEKVVLRLLSSHTRQFALDNLGMSKGDIAKLKKAFTKPYGILLSTGPTGSGKTTTIYAIVKIINSREKNIATIEDPVEYDIPGINQIQVNPKTNLTFAAGLRSILRQDPDIVFVGEIRDNETAGISVNAAMTGHLVLSTLHTNDASTTLPRLIDMGIEPFLVASTINAIIGQRLIRKICDSCRQSQIIPQDEIIQSIPPKILSRYFPTKGNIRVYQGKGCSVCHNTGYRERIGIFEVLQISPAIRKLIENKASADTIKQKAIEEGMTTMIEDGLSKVQTGITSVEEVLRATKV